MATVAFSTYHSVAWLTCLNCHKGMVSNNSVMSPGRFGVGAPKGLPKGEAELWAEIKACLSVNAFTAAVALCRKMLLHLAVSSGLDVQAGKKSPTFAEAVQFLKADGLITSRMEPWVDRIRNVGNEANHEISSIAEDSARDVASFTEQLLKLAYEMPALMNSVDAEASEPAGAAMPI